MMIKLKFHVELFLLNILVLAFCDCSRILAVFNHPASSHTSLGKLLLKNLAKRGHEVVMMSAFPMESPIPNYADIHLQGLSEDFKRRQMMYFTKTSLPQLWEIQNMSLQHTEDTFKNPQVQQLLKSDQKFDVIIIDWFFNDALLILSHIFKAPVIYFAAFSNNALVNYLTGNILPSSYVPGVGIMVHDEIPFKERLYISFANVMYDFYVRHIIKKGQTRILQRYFPSPPSVEELEEHVALVLSNSHFSFETPRPYTPALIPIGGFHIEEPGLLPNELQSFLDSAQKGVVYFNLGSQIKSSNLDKDKIMIFLEAFRGISQKVLWKYEGNDLENVPSNIKLVKWAPQLEILAHKNVKVFINHAGLLSYIEAIHFGVPMLGMPISGDGPNNAAFIESRQLGKALPLTDVDQVNFKAALTDVLENPIYQERIHFYSQLLRDRPIKPLDSAIWWIEHVIKYKGGKYLRPFASKLPWYKYYMVDVIGFVLVTFLALVLLIIAFLKCLINFVCFKKERKTKVS